MVEASGLFVASQAMHITCCIDHNLYRRATSGKIIEAKKVLPRDASENALTELCFNMRGRWLSFVNTRDAMLAWAHGCTSIPTAPVVVQCPLPVPSPAELLVAPRSPQAIQALTDYLNSLSTQSVYDACSSDVTQMKAMIELATPAKAP